MMKFNNFFKYLPILLVAIVLIAFHTGMKAQDPVLVETKPTIQDLLTTWFNPLLSFLMMLFAWLGTNIPKLAGVNKAIIAAGTFVLIGAGYMVFYGGTFKETAFAVLTTLFMYNNWGKKALNEPVTEVETPVLEGERN